jgi:hypothetical protein
MAFLDRVGVMLRIDRSHSFTELVHRSATYMLTVERIDISLGGRARRFAGSYTRPKAVVRDGRVAPILDLVMIVRLVGLLAVAIAMLVTEVRR